MLGAGRGGWLGGGSMRGCLVRLFYLAWRMQGILGEGERGWMGDAE